MGLCKLFLVVVFGREICGGRGFKKDRQDRVWHFIYRGDMYSVILEKHRATEGVSDDEAK